MQSDNFMKDSPIVIFFIIIDISKPQTPLLELMFVWNKG